VGGLTSVGLSADGVHLLVVSWQGRGVLDLRSGERVARDAALDFEPDGTIVVGIGPLVGEQVRVAGLWGGELPRATPDGWRVEMQGGNRPACEFSHDGAVLVYATTSDVTLYWRDRHAASESA
jgi:hypothetical protein